MQSSLVMPSTSPDNAGETPPRKVVPSPLNSPSPGWHRATHTGVSQWRVRCLRPVVDEIARSCVEWPGGGVNTCEVLPSLAAVFSSDSRALAVASFRPITMGVPGPARIPGPVSLTVSHQFSFSSPQLTVTPPCTVYFSALKRRFCTKRRTLPASPSPEVRTPSRSRTGRVRGRSGVARPVGESAPPRRTGLCPAVLARLPVGPVP